MLAPAALAPLVARVVRGVLGDQSTIALEIDGGEVEATCAEPLAATVALEAVLDNALCALRHSMPSEPTLRVAVGADGTVQVSDNAARADAGVLERAGVAFAPGAFSGAGLGIARARSMLGSERSALSLVREGQWTVATLRIPLAEGAA